MNVRSSVGRAPVTAPTSTERHAFADAENSAFGTAVGLRIVQSNTFDLAAEESRRSQTGVEIVFALFCGIKVVERED